MDRVGVFSAIETYNEGMKKMRRLYIAVLVVLVVPAHPDAQKKKEKLRKELDPRREISGQLRPG